MFLISIALIYVCAFSSIYVQIPGREVSLFLGGGCLAVMVDFGCGINEWLRIHLHLNLNCCGMSAKTKRGTFGSFIHSLALTVRSPVTGEQFQFKLLKDLVHKPHLHAERRILADLSI